MAGSCPDDVPEHAGESQRRKRRRESLQVCAASRDRCGEGGAVGTLAQVAAHAARPQHAPVAVGDHPAHLLTGHGATLREVEQGPASLEDRLLGGAQRETQGERDLLV